MPIRRLIDSLRRLHRCRKGVASLETVLIAPIMLLFLILYRDVTQGLNEKQRVTIAARTAAWNKALNDNCSVSGFNLGPLYSRFLARISTRCSVQSAERHVPAGDRFWAALATAAGSGDRHLTNIRRVPQAQEVVARTNSSFTIIAKHDRVSIGVSDKYVLPMAKPWTFERSEIRRGYDAALRRWVNPFYRVVPNVFKKDIR